MSKTLCSSIFALKIKLNAQECPGFSVICISYPCFLCVSCCSVSLSPNMPCALCAHIYCLITVGELDEGVTREGRQGKKWKWSYLPLYLGSWGVERHFKL